jgi:hypothetical protein
LAVHRGEEHLVGQRLGRGGDVEHLAGGLGGVRRGEQVGERGHVRPAVQVECQHPPGLDEHRRGLARRPPDLAELH